jgi:hypothetical protein
MIKLIITDLDGTFLNSQGSFDKKLYEEVRTLMEKNNIHFAPCTGKQCERVEELFGEEASKKLWILGDSATRIKHEGEYVYQSLIANELGKQIIEKLDSIASDHIVIACTPSAAIIKESVSEENKRKIKGSYAKVNFVTAFSEIKEDFVKITVYDPKKRCFESVSKLTEFSNRAYIVASEAAWIDISNYGVHKGTTVERLQKILGVSKTETMVFGDGLNDVELMLMGDYSFAVRNAFEETKAVANYIAKSNDENGVLLTIKQMLSLQA